MLASSLSLESVATPALELAQAVLARHAFLSREVGSGSSQWMEELKATESQTLALIETACLQTSLKGTDAHVMALGLLAESFGNGSTQRAPLEHIDEILGGGFSAGSSARAPTLQLFASVLSVHGLSLGIPPDKKPPLGRLKGLLVIAAGELRLSLEGYSSNEGLCAACMALEAAIIAVGNEADNLEASGSLVEVADCLEELHRAVHDVYEYALDLPAASEDPPPKELAMIARVAAAFQLEDPQRYLVEFQRSLPTFCRLSPSEFKYLLPCLQETQDWHLTPALAKVLEVAHWGLSTGVGSDGDSTEIWRQCALMLTEVALDAAVYLPEAPVPEPPLVWKGKADTMMPQSALANVAAIAMSTVAKLPRPVPAADAGNDGVRRLCGWSFCLWSAGAPSLSRRGGAPLWDLSILCGSLLASVPAETVYVWQCSDGHEMWTALAECLFAGSSVDALTWRLAMRLAGFLLDRHGGLAEALAQVASSRAWPSLSPPEGAAPSHDEEDEFALADRAAMQGVQNFLTSCRSHPIPKPPDSLKIAATTAAATATTAAAATTTTATAAATRC
eukprot:TRINITY_DN10644_c4_g4_i1.p1 TRINITY_DN10644_c4_g4~~TRINITY_DN10644_c4_g4_i1.p1  ORF type:complete len:579 (+),score=114.22 TRINITY_DN10644_c4_g4_i1:51-1739(+)